MAASSFQLNNPHPLSPGARPYSSLDSEDEEEEEEDEDEDGDEDEDDVNSRITPYWPAYQTLFKSKGYRLDTVRDAKDFYKTRSPDQSWPQYLCSKEDTAICADPGLPDNLFRGTRTCDGIKIVVKAVHRKSRELQIIQFLSSKRDDPMNHCIPVLDVIASRTEIVFVVMEQWSSRLIDDNHPCCLQDFLGALHQVIEHAAFMHNYSITHLDISLRNILTDFRGHYAYIDFELSRRWEGKIPRVYGSRGTEIPPECESGESEAGHDPFKIDVWALAVVILRACKLTEFYFPELTDLVQPMLNENPDCRPPLHKVLEAFERIAATKKPPASCQNAVIS
ncbi:kinase-like domain-containing protein [Mycena floridula]|nr:kinase-like domain-containing protein [Mycena floridula]